MKMTDSKFSRLDIGGQIVKNDDRYIVSDNLDLNTLVLSSTVLKPSKQTTGHSHEGQEEVYFIESGEGLMTLGDETFSITAGDVVLIPDGLFHQVTNISDIKELYFLCIFDGKRKIR